MVYRAITLATTGTTRDALRATLDEALTAAGWSIVGNSADSGDASKGPSHYRAWKSSKTNSGKSQDIYLVMCASSQGSVDSTGDGEYNFYIAESWNVATSLMAGGVPNAYYSSSNTDGTYVVPGGAARPENYFYKVSMQAVTGGFVLISATASRLIMYTRSSTGNGYSMYAGYVDLSMPTSVANADPAIILVGRLLYPAADYPANGGGWTREPGAQITGSEIAFGMTTQIPFSETMTYDKFYAKNYYVLPVTFSMYRQYIIIPRGVATGLYYVADRNNTSSASFTVGDTITVGGKLLVCFYPSGSVTSACAFVDTTL